VETRWSRRGHPGEPSARWARLHALALGTGAAPRADGLDLTETGPEALGLVWPEARDIVARAARAPYAPEPGGPHAARVAIAKSYDGRAALRPIAPDDVLLTSSTSESYSFLLHLLCDPGDAVLVPRPSYPLLPDLARLADVRLLPYELRYAGHFQLDAKSLPSPLELARERVRAVVVVSPNNPTGHFTSKDELSALAELGLPLIVDEVFRPFVHNPRDSFAEPLATGVPTFLLDGMSKRAGLAGLKAGWIVSAGGDAFRGEARARLEGIADSFLSVSAGAQNAIAELLAHEAPLGAPLRARLAENLALLRTHSSGTALTLLEPDAGFSAIVRLPALQSEPDLFEALSAQGVWLHPGELYELPLSPCFVLSLLCPPERIEAGIARLLSCVGA